MNKLKYVLYLEVIEYKTFFKISIWYMKIIFKW